MDRHRGLAVLEGGELLRPRGRDRAVARDDAFDEPAHRLETERQRDHVEQQKLVGAAVAGERVGLDRRAEGDDFVGVEVGERRLSEELADRSLDHRHARRSADQHHAAHAALVGLGVAQHLAHRRQRARDELAAHRLELLARDAHRELARRERTCERRMVGAGELLFRRPRRDEHAALVLRRVGVEPGLGESPVGEQAIEVVAAERRVAAGRHHLEHALGQAQQRDVEGAAAQVVDRVQPFRAMLEPIGDGRRGRLVDEPQHAEAGELRRVFRGLPLRVVEVGRHRDDRAEQVVVERVLGALAQRGEDLGRHLDRRLHAVDGLQLHHAGRIDEVVGQLLAVLDVGEAATHEALHRDDGIARIDRRFRQGGVADATPAAFEVAHGRRQDHAPANAWCRGRCRPRCAAGAGRARRRARRSAARPCRYCPSASRR